MIDNRNAIRRYMRQVKTIERIVTVGAWVFMLTTLFALIVSFGRLMVFAAIGS